MAKLIIFVCVSNTCRSPICEYFMRSKLQHLKLDGSYEVASRSLSEDYEPQGSPANKAGQEVLVNEYGIDMTPHRSRLLSEQDIRDAVMIVPVKKELGVYIADMFPSLEADKIVYFSKDIEDPWRQPYEVYAQCARSVHLLIEELWTKYMHSL